MILFQSVVWQQRFTQEHNQNYPINIVVVRILNCTKTLNINNIKSPICNVNLVCTKTSCSQTEKQQDTTLAQKATLHQIIFDRYFSAMKFNICSEVNSWYWLICTYLVVQCETFKRLNENHSIKLLKSDTWTNAKSITKGVITFKIFNFNDAFWQSSLKGHSKVDQIWPESILTMLLFTYQTFNVRAVCSTIIQQGHL